MKHPRPLIFDVKHKTNNTVINFQISTPFVSLNLCVSACNIIDVRSTLSVLGFLFIQKKNMKKNGEKDGRNKLEEASFSLLFECKEI